MTRFLYLSDTHYGAKEMYYHRQVPYPQRMAEILETLKEWLIEDDGIELLVHGGDMVDTSDAGTIADAVALFDELPVPVLMSLGNHDLTETGSLGLWFKQAFHLFPGRQHTYTIRRPDCLIHVVPNQWGEERFHWDIEEQNPHFLPGQLDEVAARMAAEPDKLQILCCHNPPVGVPAEQMGQDEDYDTPPTSYQRAILDLAERCPNLRLVLSAHSHINTHVEREGLHCVASSSFAESPFEFKLIEVEAHRLSVSTHGLFDRVAFAEYDFDAAYVQGRPKDRGFEIEW